MKAGMSVVVMAVVVAAAALQLAQQVEGAPMPGLTPLMAEDYESLFQVYIKAFGKFYRDQVEHKSRFAAFKENYDFIRQHNLRHQMGLTTFTVGLNSLADLTTAEYQQYLLRPFNDTRDVAAKRAPKFLPELTDPASEVDWRTQGAVTAVKNQGQCGSCWSFSAAGAVEGAWAIATGSLLDVAEQQLVDCSGAYGNQGCKGGLMDNAFQYIIDNGGIDTLADYPYTARDGVCNKVKQANHAVKISSFQDVPPNNEAQLLAAVAQGPVSVAIEADQKAFQLYKSGVFSAPCGTSLDHGVLVVGFGELDNIPYWIVKNSWGANWGENGYILLARGAGDAGQCGIAMQPSYPLV